jgi:hypothetical protein
MGSGVSGLTIKKSHASQGACPRNEPGSRLLRTPPACRVSAIPRQVSPSGRSNHFCAAFVRRRTAREGLARARSRRPRSSRLRPAATPCYEEHQRDDCRRRQEQAVIQSPAGAEERVDHHAGEDDDERDHQPDTHPVPVNVAGHEPNIKIDGRSNHEPPCAHLTPRALMVIPFRPRRPAGLRSSAARPGGSQYWDHARGRSRSGPSFVEKRSLSVSPTLARTSERAQPVVPRGPP